MQYTGLHDSRLSPRWDSSEPWTGLSWRLFTNLYKFITKSLLNASRQQHVSEPKVPHCIVHVLYYGTFPRRKLWTQAMLYSYHLRILSLQEIRVQDHVNGLSSSHDFVGKPLRDPLDLSSKLSPPFSFSFDNLIAHNYLSQSIDTLAFSIVHFEFKHKCFKHFYFSLLSYQPWR